MNWTEEDRLQKLTSAPVSVQEKNALSVTKLFSLFWVSCKALLSADTKIFCVLCCSFQLEWPENGVFAWEGINRDLRLPGSDFRFWALLNMDVRLLLTIGSNRYGTDCDSTSRRSDAPTPLCSTKLPWKVGAFFCPLRPMHQLKQPRPPNPAQCVSPVSKVWFIIPWFLAIIFVTVQKLKSKKTAFMRDLWFAVTSGKPLIAEEFFASAFAATCRVLGQCNVCETKSRIQGMFKQQQRSWFAPVKSWSARAQLELQVFQLEKDFLEYSAWFVKPQNPIPTLENDKVRIQLDFFPQKRLSFFTPRRTPHLRIG